MKQTCSICGAEDDEQWMHALSSGRTTQWLCHECYRQGLRELAQSEAYKKRRLMKLKEVE